MAVLPTFAAARKLITNTKFKPLLDFLDASIGRTNGNDPSRFWALHNDFDLDAGATLPVPWGKQDTSAAGSPTTDYVADAAGGQYVLQHASTNELETLTLYLADQLIIDITKKPIFEARLKIDGTAAAVLPSGTRLVAGLCSARNATLDSATLNAWLRVEGAGAGRSIGYESDDNTTDGALAASGVSYAEGTFTVWRVDASDLAAVKFYIDGTLVGTTSMAAATGNVQPFIELQKDSGTGTVKVTVDYIKVSAQR